MWLKEKKRKGRKKYRKRETSNSKEKNEKDRMKPIGSTWQGNWHKWKWRNLCDSKNKKMQITCSPFCPSAPSAPSWPWKEWIS